jgi:dTDP-4-amino-4,6-dideoxygalactose transaminase
MPTLAVNGGTPVRTTGWSEWPIYDETEIEAVMEVFKSRRWSSSPYIFRGKIEDSKAWQLERAWADYHDTQHAIAVNSGTSALMISLAAAGVGSGDEVILPPTTFIADGTAVLRLFAVPVFADVDEETGLLDPEAIEDAITDRTKAIFPTHRGGWSCDMDRIMEIADKYGIMVVADACHAHGSEWRGKKVASVSHLSGFSLQQAKQITPGEGGVIVTSDDALAEMCYVLHNDGRGMGGDQNLFVANGWNLRMNEFTAVITLAQLARLDQIIDLKEANFAYLSQQLEGIEGLRAPHRDERITRLNLLYPGLRYDQEAFGGVPANVFAQAVTAEGIPMSATMQPRILYQHPLFVEKRFDPGIEDLYGREIDFTQCRCPVAESGGGRSLRFQQTLLLGTTHDVDDIIEAIGKVKDNLDELKWG